MIHVIYLYDVEILQTNFENMVRTVVREHHWSPTEIENLYLDDADFFGLMWWYNDILEVNEELNKKKEKKTT